MGGCWAFCELSNKEKKPPRIKENKKINISSDNKDDGSTAPRTFTFRELATATKNFRKEYLLGEGGNGRVYKGHFDNTGQVVAVKQFYERHMLDGDIRFLKEVKKLGVLHHFNLVNLIGSCTDKDRRLLVYEFMPLGSLKDHLHDLSPNKEPLDWNTRMKIAVGVAKGLEYLHDQAKPPVVQGNLTSSKILLDHGYHPKLSLDGERTSASRGRIVMAHPLFVYCAPEYTKTGRLTSKSDIYSFGVILLELMTGRKAHDMTRPRQHRNLVEWARRLLINPKRLPEMVDPLLEGCYPTCSIRHVLWLALRCLLEDQYHRPPIAEIVNILSRLASQTFEAIPTPVQQNEVGPSTSTITKVNSRKGRDIVRYGGENEVSSPNAPQTFTFQELVAATRNFRREYLLGEGGFGRVYMGHLDNDGQVVAVKKIDRKISHGNREYLKEVRLSLLHHSNIVNLIGSCADGDQRLLVYEFMPLGSLKDHLHDLPPNKRPLDWNTRMMIAIGVAKGLEYLHDKVKPPVIHKDLKSSNILLGQGYHPKLGLGGDRLTHVYAGRRVVMEPPTYGYCAPDYGATGRLTCKSDVYSFGVVLLELITGRKAFDRTKPPPEYKLVEWARPNLRNQRKLSEMADPLLQGQYPTRSLQYALTIVSMCVQEQPTFRPLMKDVVNFLSYIPSLTSESNRAPVLLNRIARSTSSNIYKDNAKRVKDEIKCGGQNRWRMGLRIGEGDRIGIE